MPIREPVVCSCQELERSELVYTAENTDPVDSPWSKEYCVVCVTSEDAVGCHIVPESIIQKRNREGKEVLGNWNLPVSFHRFVVRVPQ
jgi:hypothetical protein